MNSAGVTATFGNSCKIRRSDVTKETSNCCANATNSTVVSRAVGLGDESHNVRGVHLMIFTVHHVFYLSERTEGLVESERSSPHVSSHCISKLGPPQQRRVPVGDLSYEPSSQSVSEYSAQTGTRARWCQRLSQPALSFETTEFFIVRYEHTGHAFAMPPCALEPRIRLFA